MRRKFASGKFALALYFPLSEWIIRKMYIAVIVDVIWAFTSLLLCWLSCKICENIDDRKTSLGVLFARISDQVLCRWQNQSWTFISWKAKRMRKNVLSVQHWANIKKTKSKGQRGQLIIFSLVQKNFFQPELKMRSITFSFAQPFSKKGREPFGVEHWFFTPSSRLQLLKIPFLENPDWAAAGITPGESSLLHTWEGIPRPEIKADQNFIW